MAQWRPTSEVPGDGSSIWFVVREWNRVYFHVDYGVVSYDVDAVILRRFENDEYDHWPPSDVACWMECEMPEVPTDCEAAWKARTE